MTDYNTTLFHATITTLAKNIPEQDLQRLWAIAKPKVVPKGVCLLKEGIKCSKVFFVEKGYLRSFTIRDGLEINTSFTFEGSFTTSLKSLRLDQPSDISIQAGEDAVVYLLDKDSLLALYEVSPAITAFGRALLEQLLMLQEEHSNLFKVFSAAERYRHLRQYQPHLLQRVSLSQIASYLGVARETLSRIRKQKD